MLRICSLAGETLATFSADEVEGKRVHQLKAFLAKQIGATRFQQKWFADNHTELHDDVVVPCCDVQLVVLPFVQAEDDDMEQLVSACKQNRPDELVDLLQKPLNPEGALEKPAFLRALHLAAETGHSPIVQLLLEASVDKDAADQHGSTALRLAAENGHSEVAKLLLEAGASKGALDHHGMTALHWAALFGHSEVVKLLLQVGADKGVADSKGRLPLDLAILGHRQQTHQVVYEAVIELLQPSGLQT